VPEDAAPVAAFTPPIDVVHDVSLAALDARFTELPPARSIGDLESLSFDDPVPARPPRPRATRKNRRARRADASVH
jgi:hypothetical protein